MFRWLIRFSGAALIGALLVWLWNRYNEDLLEEELEDEIPLEFDVPAQAESSPGPASSASADGDHAGAAVAVPPATADTSLALTAPEDKGGEETSAENPAPVLDSPAPTPAGAGDNVIVIKGIGPKYGAKLAEMGITTFGALLATPMDTLALAFPRVSEAELQSWLEQARELAAQNDETA